MCELFAMSSLIPSVASFSLDEFSRHGGLTDQHKDGWGVAFYEGRDAQLIREASPANDSPYLAFLRQHDIKSQTVIGHIRQATQGQIALANTQPFARELGGRRHLFAHNGDLTGIDDRSRFPLGRFTPIGQTDSEVAFCHLLGQMEALWTAAESPSLSRRFQLVKAFAEAVRPLGPANFIYSDSQYLFAHGHVRSHQGRSGYHPPGLHRLQRSCSSAQEPEIAGMLIGQQANQQLQLFASVPLTGEAWLPLAQDEIVVVQNGVVLNPDR
jgi:glutamine amidotransferase